MAGERTPPVNKPTLVDENYQLPDNFDALPTPERVAAKARLQSARDVKEGRRRERADHAGYVAGLNDAHAAELLRLNEHHERISRSHARGSFYQAFAISGALFAIASSVATYTVMTLNSVNVIAAHRALEDRSEPVVMEQPLTVTDAASNPAARTCDPLPGHRCPVAPASAH